jgi:hypothetical protein
VAEHSQWGWSRTGGPVEQSEESLEANDRNAQGFQAAMGRSNRAIEVDAATSLFDHESLKAGLARIFRRVTDAEVEGWSDKKQGL